MTELDFDELDKAVNNLMGDAGEGPQLASENTSNPVEADVSSDLSNTPTEVQPLTATQKPIAVPLAAKRRGQFMDVIRPTSNGKANNAAFTKRAGITIAPSGNQPASSSEVSTVTDDTLPVADTAPSLPVEFEATKSEWPDPIDLANSSEVKDQTAQPDAPEPDVYEIKTDLSFDATDVNAPLDSPFLANSKPEKRPLGGALQPNVDPSPMDGALESKPDVPAAAMTPAVVLPPELHDNVVSVETDTTTPDNVSNDNEQPVTTPEVAPEQPTQTSSVGGSIPQQYKEEVSTGDQTNGSIYDTANYHKAIEAHATSGKHGSVLKWIIWTLLLLVVGAGGGAAYFLLTR